MKKLTKVIAAVSAAAMLAVPANMSAFAYNVDTGKSFSNPLINYDFSAGRGQRWEYYSVQKDIPALTSTILAAKGKYTYYATTDTRCNEYGNCDIFAMLPLEVATTATINNARPYIDNLSVKSKTGDYYALSLEYSNVSKTDTHLKRPSIPVNSDACDYALRMLEGPYLQNILNNFYIDHPNDINYSYIKSHNGYTGNIYLDDHYIAGMRLSSSDPYTTFDEPVLEQKSGEGVFRTKITFHISNPVPTPTVYLGMSGSNSGSRTFEFLKDLKLTCNGDQSSGVSSYIKVGGISKKTISVPYSDYIAYNNNYDGLISCPGFITNLKNYDRQLFLDSRFNAYKRSGSTIYIYTGKNAGIGDPGWLNGSGSTKFEAFFRNGGRDIMGHCSSLRTYLQNATTVVFYSGATPSSVGTRYYSMSASTLLDRLDRG